MNKGTAPGSIDFTVDVVNFMRNRVVGSANLSSGVLDPKAMRTRKLIVSGVRTGCADVIAPGLDWTSVCSISVFRQGEPGHEELRRAVFGE